MADFISHGREDAIKPAGQKRRLQTDVPTEQPFNLGEISPF